MNLFRFDSSGLFRSDNLSWVMAGLILFVIVNVTAYSSRYLAGDRNRFRHRLCVLLLGISVTMMAFADHLLLLLATWTASNLLLVRLMIHKGQWAAARNSGLLALKTFGLGFAFLGSGFWLVADGMGTALISKMVSSPASPTPAISAGLALVALAAMTQCATWPFHRWLISSLNSPTPVSALMHAGLVNGGGFLLVRMAPLYAKQPTLLHALFVVGLVTAVVGTFWKLMQTDVKRMLACSTMGQMGFMLMQCGMGLFAPAMSHLCWHGLFKAYLFLSTGSVVKEKRSILLGGTPTFANLLLAMLIGVGGAAVFAQISGTDLNIKDTSCLMIAMAFMVAAQLAIGLLDKHLSFSRAAASIVAGVGAGGLYGLSIRLFDTVLGTQHLSQPQPIDGLYAIGLAIIGLLWIAMVLNLPGRIQTTRAWKRLYIVSLNASQPHPATITSTRTAYLP